MDELVRQSRRERYRLRSRLRIFTTATMQRRCGLPHQIYIRDFFVPDEAKLREYWRTGGPNTVRVQRLPFSPTVVIDKTGRGRVVRVTNLVWCERFTCPVCGPLMWTHAARELQRAVLSWQAHDGQVVDVVLRLAPLKARDLERSLHALMDGWDAVLGRRQTAHEHRMKFLGLTGYHQQFAIGLDADGRWDPCLRVLLFMRGPTLSDPAALRRLQNAVWQGWVTGNHDVDLRPPTRKRGITATLIDHGTPAVADAVSRYVAGVGSLMEGTRSMFEILAAACSGDREQGDRWIEIERALRRRKMKGWSRGTKSRLGLTEDVRWPTLKQRPVAFFEPEDWSRIQAFMPGPLEAVEDALVQGHNPGVALTNWAREHSLPAPSLIQPKPPPSAPGQR